MPAIVVTTVRQSVIAEVASVVFDAVDIDGAVALVVFVVAGVVGPQLDAVVMVVDAVPLVTFVAGEVL